MTDARPPWPASVRPTRVRRDEPDQQELDLEPFHLDAAPLKDVCPPPTRYGGDEYKCRTCGVIWSIDEPRPPCDHTASTKG
jgi:hypothetical protein